MNIKGRWTCNGDFHLVDADNDDAVLVELVLHEPFKEQAPDNVNHIAKAVMTALVQTPHPLSGVAESGCLGCKG